MKFRNLLRSFLGLALTLAFGSPLDANAHSGTFVEGTLTHLVGDAAPGVDTLRRVRHHVTADDGHVVLVDLSRASLPPGGIQAALNKRVRVTTIPGTPPAETVPFAQRLPIASLDIVGPGESALSADNFPLTGNRKYKSVMCKWSDIAALPSLPAGYFDTQLGNTYPGFDHYFQEISYGAANITGSSATAGWISTTVPRSSYNVALNDGSYLMAMAQNCVTAAEASGVSFVGYVGVNLMFNGKVDECCAWGGGGTITFATGARGVSLTWMPYNSPTWGDFGWHDHGVLAHELSHSFGSPHSDDSSGYQYGNWWDVVSKPGINSGICSTPGSAYDANYGCIGQHPVTNNKIAMGFITVARTATIPAGTTGSYDVERAAQPAGAGGTYQVLKVMTADAHKYYTVESRKRVGYDVNLPGDGVLIHEVVDNRVPSATEAGDPAHLVRPDGVKTPFGGAGLGGVTAKFNPGQSMVDVAANVSITVNSIGADGTANITVQPASAPGEYNFSVTSTEFTEGGAQVNIAVTRGAPFTGAGSVAWATSNGTAVAGTDFGTSGNPAQKSGTLTWTSGTGGVKNITLGLATSNIPVINNAAPESTKSFGIALSSPVGGVLGANTSHTVNINDINSVIAFDAPTASVSEAGPNITVTLTRTGATTAAQAVTYTTTAGTATATSDYTTTTGTVTFAAGETSKVITIGPTVVAAPFIRIINDATIEGPETFNVNLSAPTNGAALGAQASMVITINSDENGVSMAAATRTFAEGAGAQQIMVNRAGSAGAVSVNYAFVNGTAQNGVHYTGAGGTLNWADGETGPKPIDVTIGDDGAPNASRTFTVQLSGATGATLVAPMSTSNTITDNDNSVQFTVASAAVTEGTANLTLTVSRTGVATGGASVTWTAINGTASLGTDFGGPGTGTLTWAPGNTASQMINIPIVNDLLPNGARTFSVALSSPTGPNLSIGANSTVAVTLNDNEKVLQFEFPTYSVTEGTNPSVTIRVQRSGPTTTAASATWATVNGSAESGKDFGVNGTLTPRTGTLSWAIGDAAPKTITIPIINDTLGGEGDETFTVALTAGSGYVLGPNAVATVTIHDNDIPPETQVQFTQAKYVVLENVGTAVLTLHRSDLGPGFGLGVSVNYATVAGTALATSDYLTKSGTVTWAPGDSADKTISITIVDNATPEPPEAFKVTLSNLTPGLGLGTPGEATVLILDDDEVFPLDGAMPAGFTTPVGATKGWHVSNDPGAYDGAFSLKSDEIDDNETAGLQMAGTFAAGTVRFYVKVSTEPTFDTLQFFIDGVLQGTWSGTAITAWQTSPSYPLGVGHHTLSWIYTKDGSASVGMDAVYLDGLTTPAFVPDP